MTDLDNIDRAILRLIATDAGVGVRLLGNAAAAGDDLTKPGNDNLVVLVDLPKGVTAQVDPPRVVVTW